MGLRQVSFKNGSSSNRINYKGNCDRATIASIILLSQYRLHLTMADN
jgi:hypothetical protein